MIVTCNTSQNLKLNSQTVRNAIGKDLRRSIWEDNPVAHSVGHVVHQVLPVRGVDVAVAAVRYVIRTLDLVLELVVHRVHVVAVVELT